jgi:hypothetical protein
MRFIKDLAWRVANANEGIRELNDLFFLFGYAKKLKYKKLCSRFANFIQSKTLQGKNSFRMIKTSFAKV